jgi:endonuclease YncB( thermonuclease family)
MPFTKIAPQAGIVTDGTRYSAQGTWYDSDKVRFRKGFAEKIGGWAKYVLATYLGTARKLHDWTTDSGNNYIGVGTNLKLYVNFGDSYYDITPLRTTLTLGTDKITAVDGTAVVTIETATAHGAVAGDYVTIAGATATAGIGTAALNTEHRIVALGDPSDANPSTKFRVVCSTKATSSASGGGSSVTAAFQINVGLNEYVSGSGWGADTWGSGTWGSSATLGQSLQLRLWSIANFGDDMLANVRQGNIYYWDESAGTGTAAVALSDTTRRTVTLSNDPVTVASGSTVITIIDKAGHGATAGDTVTISGVDATIGGITAARLNVEMTVASVTNKATFTADIGGANASGTATGGGSAVVAVYKAGTYYTPTAAHQVMMSDVARHVIAFGCNEVGATAINPLLVRWSSSEAPGVWQPLSTNSAGGQELPACSEIVGAMTARQEILIWTDCGIVSMRYIGSPFYFSFTETAKGMSMVSPNAAVNAGGTVYFMDRGAFYTYTGTAQRLTCPVLGTVFDDFDDSQSYKVVAGSNTDFSEVIWFYPSESGNGEIDKYVIFNYAENIWYTGTMVRGGWSHAGTKPYPLASSIRERDLGSTALSTSSSSGTITITDSGHGLKADDEIILNDISTVGGFSTVVLNNQHTVASVTDSDTYTITLADLATSSATGGGDEAKGIYPNLLYSHESGHDDDGSAMTAYIETGDIELGEGDQFWSLNKIIPDIQFRGGDSSDEVTVSLNGHNYPAQAQSEIATATVTSSTDQAFIRGRARQVSMKVQSTGAGYGWRVGYVRLDGRTDGRR